MNIIVSEVRKAKKKRTALYMDEKLVEVIDDIADDNGASFNAVCLYLIRRGLAVLMAETEVTETKQASTRCSHTAELFDEVR